MRDIERYRAAVGTERSARTAAMLLHRHHQQKTLPARRDRQSPVLAPVLTGNIALDRLRADRDQLFAEAVELYRAGVAWWPGAEFEQQHIAAEQEARFEPDAWEWSIARFLNLLHEPKRTTIMHIALGALGYEGDRMRLSRSMTS